MKRTMSLIYGSVAYATFLACFLYAAGFVGNLFVPKSIDSGEAGPVTAALLIDAALLGLFAVQHSLMARKGFKKVWTKIVPQPIERATYVLATCVALVMMFVFWEPIPAAVWTVDAPAGRIALTGLQMAGWLMVFVSTVMIHHFDLFGMRQVWRHFRGQEQQELGYRTPGFYRYMRHPIQVGFLIAFWATPDMTAGHLFFAVMTTGYIIIAVKMFEERDLLRDFGDNYRQYMAMTGGFFPKFGKRPQPAAPSSAPAGARRVVHAGTGT
jgi:protein-S-isoprenylcysteine O-methyltransferase Ste14